MLRNVPYFRFICRPSRPNPGVMPHTGILPLVPSPRKTLPLRARAEQQLTRSTNRRTGQDCSCSDGGGNLVVVPEIVRYLSERHDFPGEHAVAPDVRRRRLRPAEKNFGRRPTNGDSLPLRQTTNAKQINRNHGKLRPRCHSLMNLTKH